jgi:hypothetical protein
VAAAGPLTIMESAALQHPLLAMLRRDVAPDVVLAHVRRIAEAVRPLEPRLVYLRVADHEATYRALTRRRGPASLAAVVRGFEGLDFAERTGLRGLDLLLAYWKAHHGLAPPGPPAPPPPDLARYVGRYHAHWRGQDVECAVRLLDGELVLDGLLWPANRLLHKGGHAFRAEAWPYEVVFPAAGGGGRLAVSLDV